MWGFTVFVDRAVSMLVAIAFIVAAASVIESGFPLNRVWLIIFGGVIAALSVLMPIYAWSRRGMRMLALAYALTVVVGLAVWPWQWDDSLPVGAMPLIWGVLGMAPVCFAIAVNLRLGVVYGLAMGVGVYLIRTSPSGGSVESLIAIQDAVMAAAEAVLGLVVVFTMHSGFKEVDKLNESKQASTASDAVNQALIEERARIDAVVHDVVMTTLVAASRERTSADSVLAKEASVALDTLAHAADMPKGDEASPSAHQFARLLGEVVRSVSSRVTVTSEIPSATVIVPYGVATALLQAAREAVLNAEKHAHASTLDVFLNVDGSARKVNVLISIADNGVGFRPNVIPPERLGLRLSMRERMQTVKGAAEVQSIIGQGTVVLLKWAGNRETSAENTVIRHEDYLHNPLLQNWNALGTFTAGVLFSLFNACMGLLLIPEMGDSPLFIPSIIVLEVTYVVSSYAMVMRHMWGRIGWLMGAGGVAGSVLGSLCMVGVPWPWQTSWFILLVIMIVLTIYLVNASAAWMVAISHGAVVFTVGFMNEPNLSRLFTMAFAPLLFVFLETLLFLWLAAMWTELKASEAASQEAARVNAVQFSKMVAREVWLADINQRVSPLLRKISSSAKPLNTEDREKCLLLESSLRDGIKAANFTTPDGADAILSARRRGVVVTLVDNRGETLPDKVKAMAMTTFKEQLRLAEDGRVVARTAPRGYGAAVTIMRAQADGRTWMTTISDTGEANTIESGVGKATVTV